MRAGTSLTGVTERRRHCLRRALARAPRAECRNQALQKRVADVDVEAVVGDELSLQTRLGGASE